jgi:hypothetical protein
MKKAIIASILMLATLTACNNSEPGNTPEEQQKQVFQNKTAAKEVNYTDEKEFIALAEEIVEKDLESGGGTDSRILCHTPYNIDHGHACLYNSSGYLVTVTWSPDPRYGELVPPDADLVYSGQVTPRCNC